MTAPQPKQWKCDKCGREAEFAADDALSQVWCQIPHDWPGDCQGFLRALPVTAPQPTPDYQVTQEQFDRLFPRDHLPQWLENLKKWLDEHPGDDVEFEVEEVELSPFDHRLYPWKGRPIESS